MAVKPVPRKFETSDGQEFDTKEEAERHDKLTEAKAEFDTAQRKLLVAFAETCKTADGHAFEFGWHKYSYIDQFIGWPNLREIEFWRAWDQQFRIDTENDDELILIKSEPDRSSHWLTRNYEFRISDLYHDRAEALNALIAKQEEEIERRKMELKKTKETANDPA